MGPPVCLCAPCAGGKISARRAFRYGSAVTGGVLFVVCELELLLESGVDVVV